MVQLEGVSGGRRRRMKSDLAGEIKLKGSCKHGAAEGFLKICGGGFFCLFLG